MIEKRVTRRKKDAAYRARPEVKRRREETSAAWYAQNRTRVKKIKAAQYAENKVPMQVKSRRYYAQNKVQIGARMKKYRAKLENRARKIAYDSGMWIEIPNRLPPDLCECCNQKSTRGFHFDHCHETGRFRGWCCHQCNTGQTAANGVRGAKIWLAYLERPWQQAEPIRWAYPRERLVAVAA